MGLPGETMRLYGAAETLPEVVRLRAGPLTLVLDGCDLRYVRLGRREVIRRLYVAVRDQNWDTIPLTLSNLQLEVLPDSFAVSFEARHQRDAIDFGWRGMIRGTNDGFIRYSMDGQAHSSFRRNRIGFCILYPSDAAGARARIEHVDGSEEESSFPEPIGPQLVIDGIIQPLHPFANLRGLAHEVAPGVWVESHFEGDVFEMEDQRNWTDASYKVYSTPLALPFPVEVAAGTPIRQSFALTLTGSLAGQTTLEDGEQGLSLRLLPETRALPQIGLGVASHGQPLSEAELERLRRLRLAHLRVDLDLAEANFAAALAQAAQEAEALDAELEIALHLSDNAAQELEQFVAALGQTPLRVARWLVFHKAEKTTSARWMELAHAVLAKVAGGAPVGGGTNVYFTELNRLRPPVELCDVIAYSINPQVHAFDLASLTETLACQAETVQSARRFCGDRPLAISPLTLQPRFNPNATGPTHSPAGELPPQVDPRQLALYGACWTLGSLKYLAEAGADSVTYYETSGWRGLMEREHGSPLPAKFPSAPGMLFPLYHVFAAVSAFVDGELQVCRSSDPLLVDGMALQRAGRSRVVLANMVGSAQEVTVEGLNEGSALVRVLDGTTYEQASHNPAALVSGESTSQTVREGRLRLRLAPFATVCIDQESEMLDEK